MERKNNGLFGILACWPIVDRLQTACAHAKRHIEAEFCMDLVNLFIHRMYMSLDAFWNAYFLRLTCILVCLLYIKYMLVFRVNTTAYAH